MVYVYFSSDDMEAIRKISESISPPRHRSTLTNAQTGTIDYFFYDAKTTLCLFKCKFFIYKFAIF